MSSATISKTVNENIVKKYERKTERQHILDTPDTYIGSIEKVEEPLWIYNNETSLITLKEIEYIPGLYKLFDEVIINARDHIVRIITQQQNTPAVDLKNVSYINVKVDEKTGLIIVENDGNGIDVIEHPEHKVWVPELIFAHLRTSTNYNKEEKRIVGGKNGFGVKLVFIWSVWGEIETVDHIRGLRYIQKFENNLDIIHPPIITKLKGTESKKPYTRISFIPDYNRLGLKSNKKGDVLTPDILSLLRKRVYDIAGVSDHSVKKVIMRYNEIPISVKTFTQYIQHYIGSEKKVYEESGTRWEYCISMSASGEFTQISFVNGICTYKGGKHVDYLIGQITRKLVDYIEIKKKVKVTAGSIKEQLILFLRCDIENPVFSSQTKDYLDLPSSKFGSLPTVSDEFIEKTAKLGVMTTACALTQVKEEKNAKKTDGMKTRVIRGIENLNDANLSGTARSKECTLILAEGLSAKAGIISALTSIDRDFIGIYPLKGKLLNVRGESIGKISSNKEITELKRILGLENKKEYTDVSLLRYGKILCLVDADMDGSHIKGLIVNLFSTLWPSLFKIEGFLSFMNTPILRATPKSKKSQTPLFFYNVGEYNTWINSGVNTELFQLKYFKGLGTSTAVEFKKYFEDKKYVDFVYNGPTSDESIDKVFNKKRPDDRKNWLENYDKDAYLNTTNTKATYEQFIDNELIHFSNYDCQRSIPCAIDGLKISQRKILYVAFKTNLKDEIKVAQLVGKVSELSHYNHGENSLVGAIVGMAQDYVGSNNINLLQPLGQFGTRLQSSGSDHASERYIFTNISPITRKIFKDIDGPILEYLNEDGYNIEPRFYVPILPFILINSCRGIGTGFSTSILPMNPLDIINYIKCKLTNIENTVGEFFPYYEGYTGVITKISTNKYLVKGRYTIDGDNVKITELPIEVATEPYKQMLDELAQPAPTADKKTAPLIKDFIDMSTDKIVNITVQFAKGEVNKLVNTVDTAGINGLEKLLKLTTTISNTNMYLFRDDLKLHKYESVEEIIDYFMEIRLKYYDIRKKYMIDDLNKQLIRLSNKARFITLCLKGTIDLRRKTNDEIEDLMERASFSLIDDSFDYLIKIPMNSVSNENVERILKEEADKKNELELLIKTPLEQIWLEELNDFNGEYLKYKKERELIQNGATITTAVKKSKK